MNSNRPNSAAKKSADKVSAERKIPTRAEHRVLEYISHFINQHGYGPSYREIMSGCGYSTLSVVSVHVEALVNLGYLDKKDRSARSIKLTEKSKNNPVNSSQLNEKAASIKTYEKWLVEKIELKFVEVEDNYNQDSVDRLYILVGALKILGLDAAALVFKARLTELEAQVKKM